MVAVGFLSRYLDMHVLLIKNHGAVGRRIDPSCGGPIELFLVPASAPRRVTKAVVCVIMSVGWCI